MSIFLCSQSQTLQLRHSWAHPQHLSVSWALTPSFFIPSHNACSWYFGLCLGNRKPCSSRDLAVTCIQPMVSAFFNCFFFSKKKRLICSLCQTWRKAWPPRAVIRPTVVFGSQGKWPLLQFWSATLLIKRAVLLPAGIKIYKITNAKATWASHFATSGQ